MQLAALAAVVSYFWSECGRFFSDRSTPFVTRFSRLEFALLDLARARHDPHRVFRDRSFAALNACGTPLRSLWVIGLSSIVMAALLAFSELYAKHTRTMEDVTLKDALLVGLAQAGALIPGVSRSGSTLTAALFLNMNRQEAARFSFLLGVPAITLAG